MDLNTDVRYIKGIGEKKAQALNKLGVFSLRDLVSFFPRKYEDRSECKPIALTCDGESVCVEAMVADTPRLTRVRRGLDLVKLRAVDDSGVLDITYFNMPYAKDNLHRGESYVFYGKIEANGPRRSMINPVAEKAEGERKVTGRIVPIYRVAQGLSQRVMQQAVRQGLDACLSELPDVLPHSVSSLKNSSSSPARWAACAGSARARAASAWKRAISTASGRPCPLHLPGRSAARWTRPCATWTPARS